MKKWWGMAGWMLGVLTAYGQERDSVTALKEVVVSYQAGQYTPVSFQNIPRETIRVKNYGRRYFPNRRLIPMPIHW